MNPYEKFNLPAKVTKVAGIASRPYRELGLKRVVASILPQIDRLNVYLNEYTHIPGFLDHPKISVFRGENLRAAGKFFISPEFGTFQFYLDDDLLYPKDYITRSIYHGYAVNAIFSYHGVRITGDTPYTSYFSQHKHYPYNQYLKYSIIGNNIIVGTGVSGFYATQDICGMFSDKNFLNELTEYSTCVDLVVSKHAQLHSIPRMILPKRKFYLKLQRKFMADPNSLYEQSLKNESRHVELLNSAKWGNDNVLYGSIPTYSSDFYDS